MNHSFDVEIAKKYGVNESIFLNNMTFWIQRNQANNRHYHDGRTWSYNSLEAFTVIFPYWSTKQIRRVIDSCVEANLIMKGNYNSTPYDRTSWFSFTDFGHELVNLSICQNGQIEKDDLTNRKRQKGTPIPDTYPDTKQIRTIDIVRGGASNDKEFLFFEKFWSVYPRKENKKRCLAIWKKQKLEKIGDVIIGDVVNRLAKHDRWKDRQYIPMPATYLHNERWKDEIITAVATAIVVPGYQKQNEVAASRYTGFRDVTQERLDREASNDCDNGSGREDGTTRRRKGLRTAKDFFLP